MEGELYPQILVTHLFLKAVTQSFIKLLSMFVQSRNVLQVVKNNHIQIVLNIILSKF